MIIYRGGISESQFHSCREKEIAAIKEAYNQVFPSRAGRLKLTFVIVGKRHNTRFYPKRLTDTVFYDPENDEKYFNLNLKPGLYVKNVITDPDHSNFYLQSHNAIKGTARAAHYHVLHDDIGFKNDDLAELTHQFCYTFGRATKDVSYASPAYIANRLCERGRVYLREWKEPSGSKVNQPRNADGTSCSTENDITYWKTRKALEISRSESWGHYDDKGGSGQVRLKSWHPDLDNSMFWM